ncbi:MAG: arabinan endo-1,5-alpha-L-arabinosidase [Verrucomicrobia bacterium]|nr:arabinan endo-1,5-alpha-L-arabinosidase [Verrucomicrobiota bacterium]
MLCWTADPFRAAAEAPALSGELAIHDPSTVVQCGGVYWVFGTGRGVISRYSSDLVTWEAGPPVFRNAPTWTTNAVPNHRGRFWAPDVIQVAGRYLLYYSVSTWGSRVSAIGLATNRTLNPRSPDFQWGDGGIAVQTSDRDDFNAIDPSVMQDKDGRLWLAFGSFWSGIKVVELNPQTGLRLAADSPMHALAWKEAIEAACLYQRGDHYYLFVNWGRCCRGVNSTYNIRVGRSASVTGPYLDKDGVDLLRGGGSLVLDTSGHYIGPGHAGILKRSGTDWLSYHFYNGQQSGRAELDLLPLRWTADGWPEVAARQAD